MTTVLSYHPSGHRLNLSTYTYTSEPRTITINGANRRSNQRSGRVIRGTNFGKDGAPKWNPYFAYARCLSANDYALTQLDSSVSAEVAVIKALVSNILREAAVEVAAEAEADGAKMEQLAARRLSLMGEADATKPEDAEDEVRKEPEGEETPAEDTEATPQEEPEEVPPDEPEESPPDDPEEAPPGEPEAEPAEEEASAESEEVPAEYEAESEEATAKGEDQAEMEEVPAG